MNLRKLLVAIAVLLVPLASPAFAAAGRENPVPVRTVAPEYPPLMKTQNVSGVVMVKCTIDEQGNVTETVVAKTTNQAFDQSATDAVKKWKFKPARQDGNPIQVTVTIPIKFVVEES